MTIIDRLRALLHEPLVHLAGGPITILSLVIGVAIVMGFWVAATVTARALGTMLKRRQVGDGTRFALAKIWRYVVRLIGIIVALTSVGIRLDALLAASTVVLVGIGFGLQNIAQNFVSGIILLLERPVARGDFVQLGDTHGSVADIGLRATRVVTRDEVTIIVPNSELITARVINHSVPTSNLRIAVKAPVAYGTDTKLVQEVLIDVAHGERTVLDSPEPEVRFESFGESCLEFSLLVWISDPLEDRRIASRLRFAIDAAFRKAGIEIPFPQRELRIRSGAAELAPPRVVVRND